MLDGHNDELRVIPLNIFYHRDRLRLLLFHFAPLHRLVCNGLKLCIRPRTCYHANLIVIMLLTKKRHDGNGSIMLIARWIAFGPWPSLRLPRPCDLNLKNVRRASARTWQCTVMIVKRSIARNAGLVTIALRVCSSIPIVFTIYIYIRLMESIGRRFDDPCLSALTTMKAVRASCKFCRLSTQ